MYLILYTGNNYYNRKIMFGRTRQDYEDYFGLESIAEIDNLAFIQNDGIRTQQIINYDVNNGGFGDYVIIYNSDTSIHSRWWVIENMITRNGQVRLELLRDVIADWYDEIKETPMFIKKGYPQSINDPAIFNNETMTFNQIKEKETFIKDKTETGWYVGYLNKEIPVEQSQIPIPGDSVSVSNTFETLEDYIYSSYTAASPYIGDYGDVCYNFFVYVNNGASYCAGFDDNGSRITPNISGYSIEPWTPDGVVMKSDVNNPRGFQMKDGIFWDGRFWNGASTIKTWREASYYTTNAHSQNQVDSFYNSQNGRIIQVGSKTMKVVVKTTTVSKTVNAENGSTFGQLMYSLASSVGLSTTSGIEGIVSSITFTSTGYYVDYEYISSTNTPTPYTIPANRTSTANTPYDIFAIPAGQIGLAAEAYRTDPRFSQKVVSSFIAKLDSKLLYDVQYVPYCPISDEFLYENAIDRRALNQGSTVDISLITSGNENNANVPCTIIIYASTDTFSKKISAHKIKVSSNIEDFKVENECDMYRLCSPNYNGQFEFSATKNNGVSGWNIEFTYKPYTPYIKVSPIFKNLYGSDFGDARGLICGGDFSISQLDEEWKRYELNNKNYQVMFDRQIQNMEVNNAVQRELETWTRYTGMATGAGTGAIAGGMRGGGIGAAIGAVGGGALSGLGGVIDRRLNETLRNEAINYAQDQFGYQLQNIKALPYSLTKIGSQNANYKIWPFVEKYSCTDVEKQALRSKLKYNGYTIERIGTISNFLKPNNEETFIQGTLIRLDAIQESSYIVSVINSELERGVYFI